MKPSEVQTREDFIAFTQWLYQDFMENKADWKNQDLESFLGALARYVEDTLTGRDKDREFSLELMAEILLAATRY